MKYFLIKQDHRYINTPFILNLFERIDKRNISKEGARNIPPITVLYVKPNPDNQYTDILDRQLFLVSEKLKKLLEKYESFLEFKTMVLIDQENCKTIQYYLPIFDKIACLSEKSQLNLDKSVINKIILTESVIGDKSIFKIDGVTNTYIIIRLDIAESILRRDFKGITLTSVDVE